MNLLNIVTVVYNAVETVEFSLLSVLRFKSPNVRLIVIDGESTDGTLDVLNKYKENISVLISEKDYGIYDAMNKSLKYIEDGWVLFLGADDILIESPDTLLGYAKNVKTIYYANSFFNILQKKYAGKFNMLKLTRKNICHQAILYPTSVFKQYSYDLQYKLLADYNLNLLLWKDNNFGFSYIPLTITVFNQRGSCGREIDWNFERDKIKIIRNIYPFWIYALNLIIDTVLGRLRKIRRMIREN